jgi:hypothetical protein
VTVVGGSDATAEQRIADLEVEARYHRQRYDLYRARMYGPRPTRPARLRELEQAHHAAEERLRHAREAQGRP